MASILTALALVPSGAHLFALPNKLGLAAEQYMVVQGIYSGWSLFGLVLIPAILATLASALMLRRRKGPPFAWATLSFLCMAGSLVIFFVWTYPANLATDNWTTMPPNWAALRDQWEYSHAANALMTFMAVVAVTLSILTHRE